LGMSKTSILQFLKVACIIVIVAPAIIGQVRAAEGYDVIEIGDAASYDSTLSQIQDQTVSVARFYFVNIWNHKGADSAGLTITAEKAIAKLEPQPEVSNPPTYEWSLRDIPVESYRQVRITTSESVPTILGFNAERIVSKENFTHEDYQETTVTVSVVRKFASLGVNIHTPFKTTDLSAEIVESSSGAKLLQPSEGLPLRAKWYLENPSVGLAYTFRVLMKVTPILGAVRFVPSVLIFVAEEVQTIAEGTGTLAVSSVPGLGRVEVKFGQSCAWHAYYSRYPVYFWFEEALEVQAGTSTIASRTTSTVLPEVASETTQTATVQPPPTDLTPIAIAIVAVAAIIGSAIVFATRRR